MFDSNLQLRGPWVQDKPGYSKSEHSVRSKVQVSIHLLHESAAAVGIKALVGSLSCVHAQVVEKVVPLAINLFAVFEVALQQQPATARTWVRIFKHSVSARLWDLNVFHSSLSQLKPRPINHVDFGLWRHQATNVFLIKRV